jgi:two-component system LytT family sensor kinase
MRTETAGLSWQAWAWSGGLWLALGLFDASETVLVMHSEGMQHTWGVLFVVTVAHWLPWALATPLVLLLARRFPPVSLWPLSTWGIHVATAVTIGVVAAAWGALLHVTFNPYGTKTIPSYGYLFTDQFTNNVLASLVLYALILTINAALESRARLARAEADGARLNAGLAEAQLDALRRQIEPHFLFNALNTAAGLVREGRGDAAIGVLTSLGSLLRRMLDDSGRHEVPLRDEMDFVTDYLAIQKQRFEERLSLHVDVPTELGSVAVPTLILQPLVENAIKHGIAKRVQGGAIRIEALARDDDLLLHVGNDGPPLPADWDTAGRGIGFANVRARLRSMYGSRSDITIRDAASGTGVEVTVTLPLRPTTSIA